jgi:hypothetical protein
MHAIHYLTRIKLPWIALFLVFAVGAVYFSVEALAQAKPFLADRHGAKGLNCAACHKESPPKNVVASAVCLGCHGDAEKLAIKTGSVRPNPHDTHLGEMACEECHRAHKPSVDACAKCHHFGLNVP